MKKIVFAAVLAFSAVASAQSFSMPHLWWPEEFTGKEAKAEAQAQAQVQMIVDSKNVQAYMNQKGLGGIDAIRKVGNNTYIVTSEICGFKVVVQENGVFPVAGSYGCGE